MELRATRAKTLSQGSRFFKRSMDAMDPGICQRFYSIAKLPMLSALWTKVLYLFRSFLQKENHSM
jgi:hypothetical protein